MHDVFISYSHKDKAIADAVCAKFESDNIRCWYAPRDIVPGADWAGSIIDAIKAAKVMVLIFTDFSNASTQVLREVNNAVSSGIPIVPLKLTETMPTKGMQYYLSTVHWLDAMNRPLEKSIDQLHRLVKAILDGSVPSASQEISAPVQPKKKKWLLPVIIIAAVVLIGAGAAVFFLTQGGADSPAVTETTGSTAAQNLVTSVSGLPTIENPLNSGVDGNLQGNYQQGGLACSDGEHIYYINNNSELCKMSVSGSDASVVAENFIGKYLGVIDGSLYYCCTRSGEEGVRRLDLSTGKETNIYSGMLEDMVISDKRIYFKNSLDNLKLYSMKIDGSDVKKENDFEEAYYMTIWNGKIYFSNSSDRGCLYCSNIDGSDLTMLTDSYVDSVTVADGWLLYNSNNRMHILNIEKNEDYSIFDTSLYSPIITKEGIVGENSLHDLHLYLLPHGTLGGNLIQPLKPDQYSVVEGRIFYTNPADGKYYVMNIDGSDQKAL